MYFDQFNQLADEQKNQGRTTEIPAMTAIKIRSEYNRRYAQNIKTSEQVVRELSDEFPNVNIPEILRPIISCSRK